MTARGRITCFAGLSLVLLAVLLAGVADYGVTYDEILYKFPGAWRQAAWLTGTDVHGPAPATLREAFASDSQHPSLHRSVLAVTWLVLHRGLGVDELVALRVPQAVYVAVLLFALAGMLYRTHGPVAALLSVVWLMALPRVWGLAHIACLDTVIAVAWTATVLVYVWAWDQPGWRPAFCAALVFSFAVCTKLHAWFIPLPMLAFAVLRRPRAPGRLALLSVVMPVVSYLVLQPGLWHDPAGEVLTQFQRYLEKADYAPIAVRYLGETYLHRPPWHYVFVLFVLTVPVVQLVLLAGGMAVVVRRWRQEPLGTCALLNLATALGIFLLPGAGGYDGVRLFLPAFYLGAVLAGIGGAQVCRSLAGRGLTRQARIAAVVLLVAVALPGGYASSVLHPAQLSYYNVLIGGLPGAAARGMQVTYWGEVVGPAALAQLNALPQGTRVKILALPEEAVTYAQRTGRLRSDLVLNGPPPYQAHLVLCRYSFFNQAAWLLQRQQPRWAFTRQGVVLAALYGPLAVSGQ